MTNLTKNDKVKVDFSCYGITASRDRIYVGGTNGTIKTLNTNGTILKLIKQGSRTFNFLSYDDSHEQLIVRCFKCIDMDGTHVYTKDV